MLIAGQVNGNNFPLAGEYPIKITKVFEPVQRERRLWSDKGIGIVDLIQA